MIYTKLVLRQGGIKKKEEWLFHCNNELIIDLYPWARPLTLLLLL